MLKLQSVMLCVTLCMAALLSPGCGNKDKAANLPRLPSDYHRDFDPNAAYAVSNDGSRSARAEPSPPPTTGPTYTVDAMVGQINGKPIYASRIFEEVGPQQLQTLGQVKPRNEFRQEAAFLLDAQLRSMVTNALVLAEAESRLSAQEQQGLLTLLKIEREKILAQFGMGSEALAQQALEQQYGHGVDEELRHRREEILINKYLSETLYPKIHVTRYEVERYYADHYDEYNPSPQIVLRLIVVHTEDAAALVDEALKSGTSFDEAARQFSTIKQAEGGLMPPFRSQIDAFSELAWPQVNQAVRLLMQGQHSPRIAIDRGWAWVYLENVEPGLGRSLQDVYLEIEQKLRAQKYSMLQRRYLAKLMEEGNYTPLDQMLNELVTVAVNRYARAE